MAGIMVTAKFIGYIRPPVGHRTKRICSMVRIPIQLRRNIVDCSFFYPGNRVGKNTVVLPIGCHRTRLYTVTGSYRRRGTGCTCRADTEFHIRFFFLNHIVDIAHHLVHIVAAPVAETHGCARRFPQRIVARFTCRRNSVRIKIVVENNAVDIVVFSNLPTYLYDMFARCRQTRIKNNRTFVRQQHVFVLQFLILRRIPV